MKKTYAPVQSDYKFIDIIEFLHQQTGPISGTQIAKALDMPYGTALCHLQSAVDRRWVRRVGEVYESGPRISGMYAGYLQGLKDRKAGIESEITKLEV